MSSLQDKVAMRHMDMYMEQEEKYTEAVMSETERLQTKLQSEMASRLNFDLSTPPVRWGPWYFLHSCLFSFFVEKMNLPNWVFSKTLSFHRFGLVVNFYIFFFAYESEKVKNAVGFFFLFFFSENEMLKIQVF